MCGFSEAPLIFSRWIFQSTSAYREMMFILKLVKHKRRGLQGILMKLDQPSPNDFKGPREE